MIAFALAALVLIGATLLFVLPPLLRGSAARAAGAETDSNTAPQASTDANLLALRDQLRELQAERAAGLLDATAYEEARRELHLRVARDVPAHAEQPDQDGTRRSAWLVAAGVPLLAMAMYVLLGNPLALVPEVAGGDNAHGPSEQQIEQMVAGLAQRLQSEPDNAQGWEMLARSYNAMGRYKDAAQAYAQLVQLVPGDAALYADYADTLGMALGQTLQGEPAVLISRALALDPDNVKALALAGSAAFERADYARAITHWTRLVEVAAPESEIAQTTATSIAEARIRLQGNQAGVAGGAGAAGEGSESVEVAEGDKGNIGNIGNIGSKGDGAVGSANVARARIAGTVDIDPALRARLRGNETVFIFARPAAGPQPPVAAIRIPASQLPYAFVLDDSTSMMANRKLSDAGAVIVGARLSATGSIAADANDPSAVSAPVPVGSTSIRLLLRAAP